MRHRKALAVCAVVAAVLVGGVSTLRTLFSPERSAKRFFENYMSGDWAAVYQEIDLPEGEMLDEAHFLQVAEAWEHSEYLDYQMEPLGQTDGDSLYLGYRFTYSATGSSAPSQLDVTLVRTGKTALLFDTYKVSLEGLVAENCTVTIPVGAMLLLDGEALETEPGGGGHTPDLPAAPDVRRYIHHRAPASGLPMRGHHGVCEQRRLL